MFLAPSRSDLDEFVPTNNLLKIYLGELGSKTPIETSGPAYHIELHVPTNSTQNLKLMGRCGQFIYASTLKSMKY